MIIITIRGPRRVLVSSDPSRIGRMFGRRFIHDEAYYHGDWTWHDGRIVEGYLARAIRRTMSTRKRERRAAFRNDRDICWGCGYEMDPLTCFCGSDIGDHTGYEGHSFVPMGCGCHQQRRKENT